VSSGLAASIHARLLNRAKDRGEDFNLVLIRFATERFLYRLSLLPEREVYWLKGAWLFDLWFDMPHRPTRDADFLGFGPADAAAFETAGPRFQCFLNRNRLAAPTLPMVVAEVHAFLTEPLRLARQSLEAR